MRKPIVVLVELYPATEVKGNVPPPAVAQPKKLVAEYCKKFDPEHVASPPPVHVVEEALAKEAEPVVDEKLKFCKIVHVFVLPRFSPTVRATEPLYEPENVSVPFVAVRLARSLFKLDRLMDEEAIG